MKLLRNLRFIDWEPLVGRRLKIMSKHRMRKGTFLGVDETTELWRLSAGEGGVFEFMPEKWKVFELPNRTDDKAALSMAASIGEDP